MPGHRDKRIPAGVGEDSPSTVQSTSLGKRNRKARVNNDGGKRRESKGEGGRKEEEIEAEKVVKHKYMKAKKKLTFDYSRFFFTHINGKILKIFEKLNPLPIVTHSLIQRGVY
ncbi:hypothetical protein PoB_004165400 [Plakobranchus ocellatus]|uniref:Uncharacterized protein n=1 Tax=Plakobranchus ocellatus TaxID=259542 RepID=A0AAV4B9V5_9GAST|nr:hypothetical protein PoB_004165400 [Plakobranchus ocellatus]